MPYVALTPHREFLESLKGAHATYGYTLDVSHVVSYISQDQSSAFETVPYASGSGMSGGNWQQSASAAAPAWTATAGEQWGGEERGSVASSQEFAFSEEFASEQANRSSSVPADMYFGASNVHELSQQQQQQQMPHLSDHILDEESFPL